MLQAALFELEGVLADTHAARRDALCRALAEDGVRLAPERYDAWCAGLPTELAVDAAVARLAPEQPAAAALDDTARELAARRAEREAAARLAAGGVSLVPGAREALDALAGALPLGVVTRARRREADAIVALAGLEPLLACVVTADDARRPLPAPDGHRLALARLSRRGVAEPGAVVAVHDAPTGVAAARAAGVRVVRVGPSADRAGADARLATIAGLTPRALAALLDPAPVPT